jgi:hypothetical protein
VTANTKHCVNHTHLHKATGDKSRKRPPKNSGFLLLICKRPNHRDAHQRGRGSHGDTHQRHTTTTPQSVHQRKATQNGKQPSTHSTGGHATKTERTSGRTQGEARRVLLLARGYVGVFAPDDGVSDRLPVEVGVGMDGIENPLGSGSRKSNLWCHTSMGNAYHTTPHTSQPVNQSRCQGRQTRQIATKQNQLRRQQRNKQLAQKPAGGRYYPPKPSPFSRGKHIHSTSTSPVRQPLTRNHRRCLRAWRYRLPTWKFDQKAPASTHRGWCNNMQKRRLPAPTLRSDSSSAARS